MRILIVEDNYYMVDLLKNEFDEKEWIYDVANKVAVAIDLYSKNQYDCFIIDLYVDPIGLTEDEFNHFYPYYGWAWFYNYVIKPNESIASQLTKKAIIYSKYANQFKEMGFPGSQDITPIDKGEKNSDEKVIKLIEKIEKNKLKKSNL